MSLKFVPVDYLYVAIDGPSMTPISIQKDLEGVADFGALESTRKVASRLELLASHTMASCKPNYGLKATDFEIIEENISKTTNEPMGDGCGFIPDHILDLLVGCSQQNRLSIQVRIFAPHLGMCCF